MLPDGKVIEYEIDIHDRRVAKKVNGAVVKRYVYEDGLNISQEVDGEGNILVQYVYGIKRNVPEFMVKDGIKYKIISDHLGSPLAVWEEGENTSPVLTRRYDSFGNILEQNGDLELPFGFAGGTWDEDTGLIRFGVRDYDPKVGRWTSKEPLGFSGSRNWYSYCDDDPVNYWDLDGEAKDSITASLEAAAASGNYAYIEELLDAGVLIGRHLALAKKLLSMRHSGEACEVPALEADEKDAKDYIDEANRDKRNNIDNYRKKEKGKSFRGGKKKNRDNWGEHGKDKDFINWVHRIGKNEAGGNDLSKEAIKELYEYWKSIGSPKVK